MSLRHFGSIVLTLLLIQVLCVQAIGQYGKEKKNAERRLDLVPSMFYRYAEALGSRVKTKGKEKTIYEGQLFDKAGNSSPVRIVHQLPNLVRLEGFKPGNSALSFDGKQGKGASSSVEETLIEIFSMNMPEGMLSLVRGSAAVRFLGHGYGPDPKTNPDYSGPRYSVYDITSPMRCRHDELLRSKLYYFDDQTMLLHRVQYPDLSVNPPVNTETHFSMWGEIDGARYPARIDHYKGGGLVFTFIAESIVSDEATDEADF
jgi:hypothetical protein